MANRNWSTSTRSRDHARQSLDQGSFQSRAGGKKQKLLQECVSQRVTEAFEVQVTMFLVNGR